MAGKQRKQGNAKPIKDDFVVTCTEVVSRKEHAEIDRETFQEISGGVGLYTIVCSTRPITTKEFREMVRMVPENVIAPERSQR